MAKKGRNIYKRKDGRWEGRYKKGYDLNGKIKYGYIYGKSYKEVKDKLSNLPPIKKNQAYSNTNVKYEQILKEWLDYSKLNVKESSYSRYYQIVYSHLIPSLGKYKIDEISHIELNEFVSNLLEDGRIDNNGGLSPKSVSDIVSIVKNTIYFSSIKGYRNNNEIKLLPIKQLPKPIRVFSIQEQSLLCKELLNETDYIKFGILLSLYTGLRIGEICALKWENINLDNGTIYVCSTMQRIKNTDINDSQKTKVIITKPKSEKSIRQIPMPVFVQNIANRFKSDEANYILTGKNNIFIEPRTMQNKFKKYTLMCGIENANYHCLRHTFATRCIESGFEIKTLSEILGHYSVNITLNRYVHSSLEMKKHEMEKLVI